MSSTLSPARVVSFEEARHIVEEHAARVLAARGDLGATEIVELLAARGRVLAEAIFADRDFPPFARATRDGYAVRAADVEQVPARLEVIGEIKAGDPGGASQQTSSGAITINRGKAVSIMTGAPLPAGADAVVMVEYTDSHPNADSHPNVAKDATLGWGTPGGEGGTLAGKFVEIQRSVKSGENFVPRAAEARAGQLLVERGRRLDHALIALAASVGKGFVKVFRKPRVAVVSTGDEVVEIGAAPGPAQIRNSNSYSLAAQIEEAGGEAVRLAIAPDEPARLQALIEEGLSCDLLLLTGGVSMGKYDLVEQVLAEMKAEFYFTGAKIQPGKPVVFGCCGADGRFESPSRGSGSLGAGSVPAGSGGAAGTRTGVSAPHYFLGLPGNPVSTMVTFRLFAQPMIAALGGACPQALIFLKARLKSAVRAKTGLRRFLPAVVSGEFESAGVELAAWQGSGDVAALAHANCYLVVPPDRERIEAGEWVSVLLP